MQIINVSRLKEGIEANPDFELSLRVWSKIVSQTSWRDSEDLAKTFPNASQTDHWTVFKLCHGECFIKTFVDFQNQKVYVRDVYRRTAYEKPK